MAIWFIQNWKVMIEFYLNTINNFLKEGENFIKISKIENVGLLAAMVL